MQKFCKKCGASLPEQKTFCSKCGTAFKDVNTPGIPPVGTQEQKPYSPPQPVMPHLQMPQPAGTDKSGIYKAVAIGGVAIILVLVGFIAINYFRGDSVDTPDTLVTAPDTSTEQAPGEDVQPAEPAPPAGDGVDTRLIGAWEFWEGGVGVLLILNEDLTGVITDTDVGEKYDIRWFVSGNSFVMSFAGYEERVDFIVINRNTIEFDGDRLTRIDSPVPAGFNLYGTWEHDYEDGFQLVFNRNRTGRTEDLIWGESEHFIWYSFNDVVVFSGGGDVGWYNINVIDMNTFSVMGERWLRQND